MFRVVPDQLKISEGWVRCGHCADVFDAQAHMMPPGTIPIEEESEPAPPPLEADTEPAGTAYLLERETGYEEPVQEASPQASLTASQLRETPLDRPFIFRRSEFGSDDEAPSVSPPSESGMTAPSELVQQPAPERPAPPVVISRPAPLAEHDEEIEDVSFLRHARRREFWRRPFVRVLLSFVALLLVVTLVLQVTVAERDRIAVIEPELRPWLVQLCEVAECRIEPPRQIETLAIDASAFNKLKPDTYRLNFTLKNNAQFPVAMPSMELTLTDSQDQPVVRRVLAPAEIGAKAATLPAGGDWSTSVTLAVSSTIPPGRVSGYRLLAFYP
jgi:predicted Zn finger-like uncharacterized protein